MLIWILVKEGDDSSKGQEGWQGKHPYSLPLHSQGFSMKFGIWPNQVFLLPFSVYVFRVEKGDLNANIWTTGVKRVMALNIQVYSCSQFSICFCWCTLTTEKAKPGSLSPLWMECLTFNAKGNHCITSTKRTAVILNWHESLWKSD